MATAVIAEKRRNNDSEMEVEKPRRPPESPEIEGLGPGGEQNYGKHSIFSGKN